MAVISGTTGADVLIGTAGDDELRSGAVSGVGEVDYLSGLAGSDIYDLSGGPFKRFIIDDAGADGGWDQIVNAGAMFQSTALAYSGWATAERVGDDLFIHLPNRPYRFRKPARPSYDIEIRDHYGDGAVEELVAGGVHYRLATGGSGSRQADIMAGSAADDLFRGRGGDDFLFGNGGNDRLIAQGGDDIVFAGDGRDKIVLGGGNDRAYGGADNDLVRGGGGNDWIWGETGDDKLVGQGGSDWLVGGEGNDRLVGGDGDDHLEGGEGNDTLIGGRGADKYTIQAFDTSYGDKVIVERGDAGGFLTAHDVIDLRGIYGPASPTGIAGAFGALSFDRQGNKMVMSVNGGAVTVTVNGMFHAANHDRNFVEELSINGAYWSPIRFMFVDGQVADIGDDRTAFWSDGAKLNEILFATGGDDMIFGGTGTNFIWTGAGADTLVYKPGDGGSLGNLGGGISRDIVLDFDVANDVLDFTEVANDYGTAFGNLTITDDAEGDAVISLALGNWEVADISIELRGVSAAEVTADMFIF